MNELARLVEFRMLRDDAWTIVRADLEALQVSLEQRGIGERIKDRAAEEAHEAWDQTIDIASEHKGIVAATLLALIAWFLRGPIGSAFEALFGRGDDEEDEEQEGGESVDADKGDAS
ncbi:MAG: hypothetical protein LC648_06635 [Novosphingobium sp.]|nr:hypothetical protein [Novosphingobium sp.]